jgi:HEAT repeat protein
MKSLVKATRKMLEQVELATGPDFEKAIQRFIEFANQHTEAFDEVVVQELKSYHKQVQSNPHFTGKAQYALICVLWERPTPKAVPVLLKILETDENAPREEIAQILGQVGDAQAVQPLLNLLKTLNDANDEYGHLRAAIVEALGTIGDPRALPLLCQLAQTASPNAPKLRRYAEWAMNQMKLIDR